MSESELSPEQLSEVTTIRQEIDRKLVGDSSDVGLRYMADNLASSIILDETDEITSDNFRELSRSISEIRSLTINAAKKLRELGRNKEADALIDDTVSKLTDALSALSEKKVVYENRTINLNDLVNLFSKSVKDVVGGQADKRRMASEIKEVEVEEDEDKIWEKLLGLGGGLGKISKLVKDAASDGKLDKTERETILTMIDALWDDPSEEDIEKALIYLRRLGVISGAGITLFAFYTVFKNFLENSGFVEKGLGRRSSRVENEEDHDASDRGGSGSGGDGGVVNNEGVGTPPENNGVGPLERAALRLNYEGMEDILEMPAWQALDKIVTAELVNKDEKKAENAYKILAARLKDKGGVHEKIGEMLELVVQMYGDGTMNKAEALNPDVLTIKNWPEMKTKFKSANALERNDKLRQMEVYKKGVQKISDMSYYIMLHPKSPWSASSGWSMAVRLMEVSHDLVRNGGYLLTGDGDYRVISAEAYDAYPASDKPRVLSSLKDDGKPGAPLLFPPDEDYNSLLDQIEEGDGLYQREDIAAFIWNMAWYDSSLSDNRYRAALAHYGVKKSSFKHGQGEGNGEPADPVGLMNSAGYQIKNNDQGKYATAAGALIRLPRSIVEGKARVFQFLDAENSLSFITEGSNFDFWITSSRDKAAIHEEAIEVAEEKHMNFMEHIFEDSHELRDFIDNLRMRAINTNTLSPFKAVWKAPLKDYGDGKLKRSQENNYDNYMTAFSSTEDLFNTATESWSQDLQWPHTSSEIRTFIHGLIKNGIGSKISMAYAYRWAYEYQPDEIKFYERDGRYVDGPGPNANYLPLGAEGVPVAGQNQKAIERSREQREYLNAIAQLYLIYILTQIPWDDTVPIRNPLDPRIQHYEEILEIFAEEVYAYAHGNTSFGLWNKYFERSLKEIAFLAHPEAATHKAREMAHDHHYDYFQEFETTEVFRSAVEANIFRRKTRVDGKRNRRDYWRELNRMDGKSWLGRQMIADSEINKEIVYPFKKKSETDPSK